MLSGTHRLWLDDLLGYTPQTDAPSPAKPLFPVNMMAPKPATPGTPFTAFDFPANELSNSVDMYLDIPEDTPQEPTSGASQESSRASSQDELLYQQPQINYDPVDIALGFCPSYSSDTYAPVMSADAFNDFNFNPPSFLQCNYAEYSHNPESLPTPEFDDDIAAAILSSEIDVSAEPFEDLSSVPPEPPRVADLETLFKERVMKFRLSDFQRQYTTDNRVRNTNRSKTIIVCPARECRKKFTKASNAVFHFETHGEQGREDKVFCPHENCAWGILGFRSKQTLSRHVASVHGNGRYKCTTCSKSFKRKDGIRRHLLTKNCNSTKGSINEMKQGAEQPDELDKMFEATSTLCL